MLTTALKAHQQLVRKSFVSFNYILFYLKLYVLVGASPTLANPLHKICSQQHSAKTTNKYKKQTLQQR